MEVYRYFFSVAIGKHMLIKPMRRLNLTIKTVTDQDQNKGEASGGTNIDEKNDVVKQTIESEVMDTKDIEVVNEYGNSASEDDKDISKRYVLQQVFIFHWIICNSINSKSTRHNGLELHNIFMNA